MRESVSCKPGCVWTVLKGFQIREHDATLMKLHRDIIRNAESSELLITFLETSSHTGSPSS